MRKALYSALVLLTAVGPTLAAAETPQPELTATIASQQVPRDNVNVYPMFLLSPEQFARARQGGQSLQNVPSAAARTANSDVNVYPMFMLSPEQRARLAQPATQTAQKSTFTFSTRSTPTVSVYPDPNANGRTQGGG
jgi:hypothetical protein